MNVTILIITLFCILLSACSGSGQSIQAEQASIEYDLLYSLPQEQISFNKQVLPVLEKRCIVCHGCYDAPCQLKLSSAEGIARGASEEKVYDGSRILAAEPTRLFLDAQTTSQWRNKGFHAIVNEGLKNPRNNLDNSVMYKMLRLKQQYPQPRVGMLPEAYDISLDRRQSCPAIENMNEYANEHPEGGMPYGLPNLDRQSYSTLVHWLAQGAYMPPDSQPSETVIPQIKRWERFLNGTTKKEKLFARYFYEHLFHAHLHFKGSNDREFYRIVRSATPPGKKLEVIATRRPYGPPGSEVYYRLVRFQGSIVAKNHLVYELSDARMKRLESLFLDTAYQVDELPDYSAELASNPIKAFAAIPVKSRYLFLLDDARFFIEGFIKGPVCRGQIALNVIEDQFWVVFFDPDAPVPSLNDKTLNATANYLASPAEMEDNFSLLASRFHYRELFEKYIHAKQQSTAAFQPVDLREAMTYIWNGDNGTNPNAALTVFRHFDSASVHYGFVGDYPETAWVLDYSVLERIHYLLVAGFDVYGNLGHQLNTRLYMDFLRTEGEDYFLSFLPADSRREIRDSWYQGIRQNIRKLEGLDNWLQREYVKGYQTAQPQLELYQHLETYLGQSAGLDRINRCNNSQCISGNTHKDKVDRIMQKAAKMDGDIMQILPDLAFVRVELGGKPENDLAYTFISNKAYKSVSSLFEDEDILERRDYEFDTQSVVPWLEGSYPNFFYHVSINDLDKFIDEYNAIQNREQYEIFVARYGVRRTSERFWEMSDWFNAEYRREQPRLSGLFDLNRYQNR